MTHSYLKQSQDGIAFCGSRFLDVLSGSQRSLGQTVAVILTAICMAATVFFSFAPIMMLFRLTGTILQYFWLNLGILTMATTRRRAEIQIERTIAVLGAIYSQLLTYRSTSHVVDDQHLAGHVVDDAQQLQDYLEALREVKGGR